MRTIVQGRGTAALGLVAGLVCLAAAVRPAAAVPRYSARYEQKCALCHVNPSGGAQRSAYAAQYLVPSEIAARGDTPEALQRLDPQISEAVSIGLDLRTIYHAADTTRIGTENFIQMQGSFYLTFQPAERWFAQVARGQSGTTEVFGAGYILPLNGYVKFGRFVPDFGWRFADHTMFVRQTPFFPSRGGGLGGRPATLYDVGVEAGLFPRRGELTLGVVNGSPGSTVDTDDRVAVVGRALYRAGLGPVGVALGGSFWRNKEAGETRTAAGPFAYLKLGPLVWLAEADWSEGAEPGRAETITHFTTSHQVGVLLARGWEAIGTYDFHDPDIDLESGAVTRWGAGVQFTPVPFLALHAAAETYRFDAGPAIREDDYAQVHAQVHFFY